MPGLLYLLDTDWVIDYLKGDDVTVKRVDDLLPQGIGLSIISLAELYEGLEINEGQQDELILLTNNRNHIGRMESIQLITDP